MAKVTIRYWAAARSAAGVDAESVDAGTLAEALAAAVARRGKTDGFARCSRRLRIWSTASRPAAMSLPT